MAVTPPESPASLLERAAQRLLELSSDPMGPPQPWWVDWHKTGAWGSIRPPEVCGRGKPLFTPTNHATVSDVEWVTVMSPSIARLLVEMLRDAARRMDQHDHLDPNGSTYQRCALDIARAILGEPVPGEDPP
jgi:hypothetical protein